MKKAPKRKRVRPKRERTITNQVKNRKGLTLKQELFVQEYLLVDGNATQAAIRAGYSVKTAKSIGARLLTFVDVKQAIQREKQEVSARVKLSQDEVVHNAREVRDVAFEGKEYNPANQANRQLMDIGGFGTTQKIEHSGHIDNPMSLAAAVLNVKIEVKSGENEGKE